MCNVLLLNLNENLIIDGRQHITNDEVVDMKRRYSGFPQFKVVLVCDVVYGKWNHLPKCKRGCVSIKNLTRISNAFLDAMKYITPRRHYMHAQMDY